MSWFRRRKPKPVVPTDDDAVIQFQGEMRRAMDAVFRRELREGRFSDLERMRSAVLSRRTSHLPPFVPVFAIHRY